MTVKDLFMEKYVPGVHLVFEKSAQIVKKDPSSLKIEWLDSEEAAKLLRLSVGALRNMTSSGQIPFYKLGNRNRYRKDELEGLLLSQRKGKLWASN